MNTQRAGFSIKKSLVFKIVLGTTFLFSTLLYGQVWQWLVVVPDIIHPETKANATAFLWIPENCKQIKAVVFGMHNMTEEAIMEDVYFRKEMSKLDIVTIWVTPGLDVPFDFHKGVDTVFQQMMDLLATESGYSELSSAPIIPIGHSALASFPWNFGAWNPNRTLAILSIHGDAPLTTLTGSGKPNPD